MTPEPQPWEVSARTLERLVRAAPGADVRSGLGAAAPPVRVSALGVRDEFAVTTPTPPPSEPAVPVHLYGQHAIVGPFPAPNGRSGRGSSGVPGDPYGTGGAHDAGGPYGAGGGPVADGPHGDGPHGDGPHGDGPHGDGPHGDGPQGDGPHGDGPQHQPCARCLARRWQAVRSVALRDALELGSGTRAAGASPYATPFAADAIAALVAMHCERQRGAAHSERQEGAAHPERPEGDSPFAPIYLVDLETLEVRRYPLVPDPQCPVCGRREEDSAQAATLTLAPAPEHAPGTFRVRPIDSYRLPVAAFANPICGALGPSVVYDVSSTSTSASIGCFSMRSGEYLRETFWGGHADSFEVSARVGVLEGLERYAGMRARGKVTKVTGSLTELAEQALDPRQCGLYSDDFYRDNPRITPFSPDRVIPWVWGYSLRDHRPVLVPEVLTYYHAPGLENRFVQESSNGCASGGSLEEAAYFGLLEVIERDAFLLAWYGMAALPEIDPATSARARTRHMVDRLAMYGYEARFFDARVSFPVPVVTAVAVRPDWGLGTMCFGAGAGLDPEAALSAALCEIATDAVNLQRRTEQDEPRLRAMADDFDQVAALHDHPLCYGIPEMAEHAQFLVGPRPRPGQRVPPRPRGHSMAAQYGDLAGPSGDLQQDLERCVAAVTAAGFDVLVVDQTLPEQRALGLTTVSVLVPGLLPIDFGWRRQRALGMPRLRTALREAGLRDSDLTPQQFNPAPHPFP
ncbi:TOMM precursor leader peptide-binding protein [Streptomyces zagrosensis]|uniref:Ribosomal protein S12 methylthiotransferase accessory factor n=1 Tax=Streptomyces zagrosensis TaxID=1042984 RepID=A0A7W9V1M0_9ACTN|nr:TOMM precursor leader peptide-binding protein [Streptomyces zagrosensis]MBB5937934.1 ribosomal protein S12 methylthiotransferase accessory factor [Streptomyces zagrosensis]